MEVRQLEGNGQRYVMRLALPDRSDIGILRVASPEEYFAVPAVDSEGLPAMTGREPRMEDLEALVKLHIRYEVAVLELARANELDHLGLQFGIEDLSDASLFKALRVAERADRSGRLKSLLARVGH